MNGILPTTSATVGAGSLVIAKKPGLLARMFRWLFGGNGATVVVSSPANENIKVKVVPTEEDIEKARERGFKKGMDDLVQNFASRETATSLARCYKSELIYERDDIIKSHLRGKILAAYKYIDQIEEFELAKKRHYNVELPAGPDLELDK